MLTCANEGCGVPFEPRSQGKPQRFCSPRCRDRAQYLRARADGRRAAYEAAELASGRRAVNVARQVAKKRAATRARAIPCPYCGEMMLPPRKQCGAATCRKAHRAVQMGPVVQRRRAARAGVASEKFDHREIFERDRWRCGICGRRVDRKLRWPHPKSASLDHVVPLSQGGEHARANTRLAHLGCNIQRNNRGGNEQLSLVG